MSELGYWVLSVETFLEALYRVKNGEEPDAVYGDLYANSDIEPLEEIERN